jgi:hypothetical protein
MMDICKNCKTPIEGLAHLWTNRSKCNNPVAMSLIGLTFMDGYYMMEVKSRSNGGYSCDGRGNKVKGKIYSHDFIVKHAILK